MWWSMSTSHVSKMTLTVISHSVQPGRAFHSTLSTTVVFDPLEDCVFFALYSLPQSIIIDRYELSDRRLSFEFWGEPNLELPVFALDQTANSLLLINVTSTVAHAKQLVIDIPVHARYGEPSITPAPHTISISSPACFWACPSSGAYAIRIISCHVLRSPQPVSYLRFPPSHP